MEGPVGVDPQRRLQSSRSNIPFPRVLNAPGRAWKTGDPADFDNIWDCFRELTPEEIDRLAEEIVAEVRLRGPFLSLADFVNRRLKEDETGMAARWTQRFDGPGSTPRLSTPTS